MTALIIVSLIVVTLIVYSACKIAGDCDEIAEREREQKKSKSED